MERVFRGFRKISRGKGNKRVENIKGYELLMGLIDRKVFGVENPKVTREEFSRVEDWVLEEYNKDSYEERHLGGRKIRENPEMYAEVIGGEPVYLEIVDYGVRYRVNMFRDREEIDIRVLDEIKEKELQYGNSREVVYQL